MSKHRAYRRLYTQTRARAKSRGIEFNLEYEIFVTLVSSPCEYCAYFPRKGRVIRFDYPPIKYVGIDRKDSTKGYTVKNSYSCCIICNVSKNNLTFTRWKNWVKRAYRRLWKDEKTSK